MKTRKLILLTLIVAFFIGNISGQNSNDVVKETDCNLNMASKPKVAVFGLTVSAPNVKNNVGLDLGNKLSNNLKGSNCYDVIFEKSFYVPKDAQAYISGNLKDFYASEGALGKPRLYFELELRDAITQKILAAKTINLKGKIYLGYGPNKPFNTIFLQALEMSKEFLFENKHLIPEKEIELVVNEADQTAYQEVVEKAPGQIKRTESTWEQMKNHSDKKREENRNLYLGKSEYYNEEGTYKSLSKTKGDEYILLKINGNAVEANKQKGLLATVNTRSISGNEIELQYHDIGHSKIHTIKMYDPVQQPKLRTFYLGTKNGTLNEGANETFWINCKFSLGGGKSITAYYEVYKGEVKKSNINNGEIKILYYEPQRFGIMDFEFKLEIQNQNESKKNLVEGRLRARLL